MTFKMNRKHVSAEEDYPFKFGTLLKIIYFDLFVFFVHVFQISKQNLETNPKVYSSPQKAAK